MSDRHLILSIFPDEAAAERAAEGLKESGMTQDYAMGLLALDEKGELKMDKVGARSIGKGAAIGGVLALVAPVVLGAGLLFGGAAGALHHKSLGMSDEEKDQLAAQLQDGKVALGVLAPEEKAQGISDWISELGGTPAATHVLSDEAIEAAQSETPTA